MFELWKFELKEFQLKNFELRKFELWKFGVKKILFKISLSTKSTRLNDLRIFNQQNFWWGAQRQLF